MLFALGQQLFIGIFLQDMVYYSTIIWPLNMVILGVASAGVFINQGKWINILRNFFFVVVVALPIGLPFFSQQPYYFFALDFLYFVYFSFIFLLIIKFLIKPSYINVDIISACACGYLLLVEISAFIFQFLFYQNTNAFKGISALNSAETFIDLVYFSSITLTSIGFGDIIPNSHSAKLCTSFFGIVGQFYTVVLVGILISKFSSKTQDE